MEMHMGEDDNNTVTHCRQFSADFPTYAVDWTGSMYGYVLVGSFAEDGSNKIEVLKMQPMQPIRCATAARLNCPATQVQWAPHKISGLGENASFNIFASTGSVFQLWRIEDGVISTLAVLKQDNTSVPNYMDDSIAPTTAMDWNTIRREIVVTGSVDTTCVVWDIERQIAQAQLIAHDKEVFDVEFLAQSAYVFVSGGAEGSLRMFDLRSLEHSTILYETSSDGCLPLLRVSANTQDQHLVATFHLDSNTVHLIDIRFPGTPVLNLSGHEGNINCVKWAPGSRHICATGGDDGQVLIWNTATNDTLFDPKISLHGCMKNSICKQLNESAFFWNASAEINNLCWSDDAEWIGVCWGTNFQALKV
ncbi:hypothetical protein PORY_000084 [Pneumocystis oryctolagi]|uniref:Uncharacterized protein n=1 Tax=Pneumocystis oryctolagi TaxID=42067 RepID=A0ACB7CEK6_9ASCO|nr:hypothetical protein PORY_000084 [Pneumocystis oryctolagi]